MKRFIFTLIFAMFLGIMAFASPAYASEPAVVTVSGQGTISVSPDVAHISLGVETQNANPVIAQQTNSTTMSSVIAAITGLGIEENDIQTRNINMHPIHSWRGDQMIHQGYMVTNNISVTVRDIDDVGRVMSAATEAGANMSSNVFFTLLDSSAAYNQALALAIADATSKAQTITRALGQRLGTVVHVGEMGTTPIMPLPRVSAPARAMMEDQDFGGMAAAFAAPIHGGEMEIVARVQVTFSLLP